jgi:hypothetical protein
MYQKVVSVLARNGVLAVTFLAISLHTACGATFAWNASTSPNVTGYTLRYGTVSGSYPFTYNVGNALTATLSTLTAGTRYYFVVTARNAAGLESDPSNEISFTPSGIPLPNVLPTLDAIGNRTLSEDAGTQTVSLTGITAGLGDLLQTLTVTASSSNPGLIPTPVVSYTSPNTTGTLTLRPVANAIGTATITVTVNDGGLLNNLLTRSFTVTVNSVNDAPTLNAISSLALNVNAGQQTVSLAGIGTGAANESQALTVTATSSNPSLIPTPSVTYSSPSSTGTLRFTPVTSASGAATITVTVNDGQSQNNIVTRSFTVTVSALANTPPTLNALNNVVIAEDAATQSINLSGITAGVSEAQTLTVTATSSIPGLIPTPSITYTSPGSTGTLRFTPAANASGTATITVTVNDGQAQNNTVSRSFTATVNPVNDTPTLNGLNNLTLTPSAGQQTVALSGIGAGAPNESQTLTVTATSSNPSLIPAPSVTYTSPSSSGTLRFTPAAGATGTATITVAVNDGQSQNNIVNRSFTVTVSASVGQTIYIEAEAGVRVSPMILDLDDSAANGQYIYSTSANAGTVSYSFNSQAGTYRIWCRVFSSAADVDSFFVSMDGGPEEIYPTAPGGWASAWQWTRVNVSGVTRTYSLSQGTHTLVFRGREAFTPLDALYITTDPAFVPPAVAPNTPPTLNPLSNLTLAPNVGTSIVALSGISAGAAGENQTLTITATSSNPGLIPHPTVAYTSPSSTGTLRLTPVGFATGSATITVTVNDGQSQNNIVTRSFTVDISNPASLFIYLDAETGTRTSPMTVGSPADSAGGQYVYSPTDNQGTVSIPINIPVTGTYWVWCRVLAPDNSRDSFFVAADGGVEEIFSTAQNSWSGDWQWTLLNGHLTSGERAFNWVAGTHRLIFRGRERFSYLDALYITNDRTLTPAAGLLFQPATDTAAGAGEDSFTAASAEEPALDSTISTNSLLDNGLSAAGAGALVTGLAVTRADARGVTLAWQTDKPASCLVNYGKDGMLDQTSAWTVGPTTDHEVTLADLDPEGTYILRVIAIDSDGNMTSTDLATVTTSPVNIVAWSAEDGDVSGTMFAQSDGTEWNGGYIASVSDGDGMAFYGVPVTVASDYRLWCRARLPSGGVSLGVSVNDTSEQIVELAQSGVPGNWQWLPITGDWLRLKSAVQTITLRVPGAEVSIDELVLSNDPRWTPEEAEDAEIIAEGSKDP